MIPARNEFFQNQSRPSSRSSVANNTGSDLNRRCAQANRRDAQDLKKFSGRHLSGFVCHRRMQPYSSPPDRLKNTLPHVGPTTSLRTVILRGDRGLAHTVAMIEVTCDVSFGSKTEVPPLTEHVRSTPQERTSSGH